eukprot:2949824-Amphidinium_carterae.1
MPNYQRRLWCQGLAMFAPCLGSSCQQANDQELGMGVYARLTPVIRISTVLMVGGNRARWNLHYHLEVHLHKHWSPSNMSGAAAVDPSAAGVVAVVAQAASCWCCGWCSTSDSRMMSATA